MKLIIAGTRTFSDYLTLERETDKFLKELNPKTEVVIISGGAKGADELAEIYAETHDYKLEVYPAEWDRYGLSAGYMRNAHMSHIADACIAFWNTESHGTRDMIGRASQLGLEVRMIRYKED